MNTFNHGIIMAAGRGARMMPLTNDIPKPMAPFNGTTLIANSINKIRSHIPNLHITVGYKKAMLATHVIEQGVASVFNTEGKGNAWWIYNTLVKFIDEAVIVLTCDNVVELDFSLIAKDYIHLGEPACMVVPVKPIKGLEGDYIFHQENRIIDLNRNKPSDMYCSGIQIINPAKVNSLTKTTEDFYQVWTQLIEKKQLYCSNIYPKTWFTVDTIDQLGELNSQNPY